MRKALENDTVQWREQKGQHRQERVAKEDLCEEAIFEQKPERSGEEAKILGRAF